MEEIEFEFNIRYADKIDKIINDYRKVLNYDLTYCGLKETRSAVGFQLGNKYYTPVYIYKRSIHRTYNFIAFSRDSYSGSYGNYNIGKLSVLKKCIDMARYVQPVQWNSHFNLYDDDGVIIPSNNFVRMIYHIKKFLKI